MINDRIMFSLYLTYFREIKSKQSPTKTLKDFYISWSSYQHILPRNKYICKFLERYLII